MTHLTQWLIDGTLVWLPDDDGQRTLIGAGERIVKYPAAWSHKQVLMLLREETLDDVVNDSRNNMLVREQARNEMSRRTMIREDFKHAMRAFHGSREE